MLFQLELQHGKIEARIDFHKDKMIILLAFVHIIYRDLKTAHTSSVYCMA